MPDKVTPPKKLSDKSTKQEMLDAYQSVVKQLEEKRATELNPEKRLEEKKTEAAVKIANTLSPEGVDRQIGVLKSDIGKMLAEVASNLEAEVAKYKSIQKAIEGKEQELQELYGIEKSAGTLAALIESQNQKWREFEVELAEQKEELTREIETTRADWEKERKQHEIDIKERDTLEKKARDREKEEYTYGFKRDQQAIKDQLNDEKQKLEKDILQKKEAAAKELAEREKAIVEKERELAQLREKVAAYPKELETTVTKALQEATERIKLEAKNREDLLRKEFEGQKNVLSTRIESLDRTVKEQADQNAKFSRQLETAYQKVQDIAQKAIEGSSQAKSFAELQKLLAEQSRKPAAEKA
jgi:hypothetical protein